MITDVQQYRIHNGDKEAFLAFCRENSLPVYRRALNVLHEESAAKAVTANVLRRFRAEILMSDGPLPDADTRLNALSDELLSEAAATRVQPETTERETQLPPYKLENVLPEPIIDESTDEIRYDGTTYRPRKKGYALIVALVALPAILLLWLALAALMRAGILPDVDLGYSWFNAHVFNLFHIQI